jgi:energy-coupling factor transporter ATP-binding protein EcfA2
VGEKLAANKARLGVAFSIGGDQAEADPFLDLAFYESGQFEALKSHSDPRCFLIGRTGSGKSALLHRLGEVSPEKVIRVVPEDLSMPYITDLDVVQKLTNLGVDLSPFWKALWRHVLIVEVIRHRYKIDSPESKVNVLQSLRDRLGRNSGKREALAYLDEFEGKFWAETDQRVREITTSLTRKLDASGSGGMNLGAVSAKSDIGGSIEATESERKELAHRYQRVVNETQLARLSKMMEVLDDDVLAAPQDFTYIVIDDLDKDWVDSKIRNDLILALVKTVHDLKRVKHLKVLVALRTNIFVHLDFGDSNAGQEEKYRSLVLPIEWDRRNLTALLDKRIRLASQQHNSPVQTLSEILPHQNSKRGSALDYLIDRTMLRPRDFIGFVQQCLAKSEGKLQISWDAIKQAEVTYSEGRLLALRDEWKLNFPGVGEVLENFRRASGRMDQAAIQMILDDCILLLASAAFSGASWMTTAGALVLENSPKETWASRYLPLLRLLFDIGFLGVSWKGGRQPTFRLEDENALKNASHVDEAEYFYIARMYHSALEVALATDP